MNSFKIKKKELKNISENRYCYTKTTTTKNHLSDLEVSYVMQIWNQFSKVTVPNYTDQHILTTEYFLRGYVLLQIPTL